MATYGVKLERSGLLRLPPHEGSPSDEGFRDWCHAAAARGERLAVDLFSGAGGLSLGLEQAGWTVVAAVDHDQRAVETHQANFRGRALRLDLADPDARDTLVASLAGLEIDLVAGGPPCQPYSRAGSSKIRSLVEQGTRDRFDPRRELWRAYLALVLELRPRAVLMENVPDMGLADDFQTVRRIVGDLEQSGYRTQVRIMETWRYRVPQHRRRLIVLARRDGAGFTWPEDADARVTIHNAIADLPRLGEGTGSRELPYVEGADLSAFAREMRCGATYGSVHDHFTRPVREDDRQAFALMTSDTLYKERPDEFKRYRDDSFDDKYNRLGWDELSRTVTAHIAKDGYWYIHPEELRTLTVREAARIQTFPDWFRFAGYRSDAFKQIGNAVPPLAGAAAARAVAPAESGQAPAAPIWSDVYQRLEKLASDLGAGDCWTAVPGTAMTLLVAAACALLSRPQPIGPDDLPALQALRGCDRLDETTFDACLHLAPPRSRRRLERLRRLVDVGLPDDAAAFVKLLGLRAAQTKIFMLLRGYDVLITGTTTVRVAARFRGSQSYEQNLLTDGRIDLARLVGTGEDAPARMAAIRHLGMTVCDPGGSPNCAACPLAGAGCVYAGELVARLEAGREAAVRVGLFA